MALRDFKMMLKLAEQLDRIEKKVDALQPKPEAKPVSKASAKSKK